MLLSKANLTAKELASGDEFDQGLNGLRIEPDGATVGGSRRGMMVVSPVERRVPLPTGVDEDETDVGEGGLVLELGHVEKICKAMPRDKRNELQHVALTSGKDTRKVEVACWDRTTAHRIASPAKMSRGYPDWRPAVTRVVPEPDTDNATRVCVDRRELIHALKALGDACPDKGDWSPVWLQASSAGVLLRAQNYMTGQTAMAVVLPHERVGGWLDWSTWERRIWGAVKTVKKRLRRRKK